MPYAHHNAQTAQQSDILSTRNLDALVKNEDLAKQYLQSIIWPDGIPVCPRCGNRKTYSLSGERFRCASCKYTFRLFSGRWLDSGSITGSEWLALIQLFTQRKTMNEAIEILGLSYNTVFKAFMAIRFAIVAHAPDAKQFISPVTKLDSYLKGSKLTGGPAHMHMDTIPVYGIIDHGEWAFIDIIPGFQAETLFHFHMNFKLKLQRAGHLVYSDKYRDYAALLLCGNETLPYTCIRRSEDPVSIDESQSEFWKFTLNSIRSFRGISCQRFPLYLKEVEFRFNNRNNDINRILTQYLCDFVIHGKS